MERAVGLLMDMFARARSGIPEPGVRCWWTTALVDRAEITALVRVLSADM